MKNTKYILLTILIIAALTITACEENTLNNDEEKPPITEDKYEKCEELGGTPLREHSECEFIGTTSEMKHTPSQICEILQGEYEPCASACRHDPETEICIDVCVEVCRFN